jgi:hypothetical protein
MKSPLKLRHMPLIIITLVALVLIIYSMTAYSTSYATLRDFQVYVDNVSVSVAEKVEVNVTFVLFNPSGLELRLTYIEEKVLLNGTSISIERPYLSRYDTGGDYIRLLPTHANSTVNMVGQVEDATFRSSYDPNADYDWSFRVVVSLENVPLVEVATLWRSAFFHTAAFK